MTIRVSTPGYNPRRYRQPWIARVTGWQGSKPAMDFGAYVGDPINGGLLTIDAAPGDIVRIGQKDTQRTDRSQDDWRIVAEDGETLEPTTRAAAYERYLDRKSAAPAAGPLADITDAELLAEVRRRGLTL